VVRVFGTEATFVSDDAGPRWHPERDGGAPARPLELAPLPATKSDLAYAFAGAVAAGTPPAERNDHLDVVAVCAAADLSLTHGATVAIDYP
jgi:hypothetical protein